jgi:hypothetical protein
MGGTLSTAAAAPTGTVAPLPGGEAVLIGLLVLVVVLIPFLWQLVGHANTMAHEGMHAILAVAFGFTLLGVALKRDTTGETAYLARTGLKVLLVGFVGYLGPSVFGLGAAKLIETGHVISVLWIAIILLVLLIFVLQPSFGLFSVPAAVALLVVVVRYAHTGLEEVVIYAMTWLLLLSGVRAALAHNVKAADAHNLSRRTHLPRHLWALMWIAGTLCALAIGGKWLILG